MMSKRNVIGLLATTSLLAGALAPAANAAIALDRTRVVFDGSVQSVSLSVSNQNKQLPYLAQ
ncbi:molecular chaperone, partial [Serratia nematodiphila]